MIKVSCPNCGVRLTASNDYVGQLVNCQKCNTKFVLSKRWMNEPMVVVENGSSETVEPNASSDSLGIDTKTRRTQLRTSDSDHSADNQLPAIDATATDTAVPLIPVARSIATEPLRSARQSSDAPQFDREFEVRTACLDGYVEARSVWEFFDFRFRRYLTPWILRISWILVVVVALIWGLIISYAYVSALLDRTAQFPSGIPKPVFSPFFVKSATFLTSLASIGLALIWIRVLFESIMMMFSIGKNLRVLRDDRSDKVGS